MTGAHLYNGPPQVHAPAKINLTLHIGRIIKDVSDPFFGYHPLDSLVVFADCCDDLRVAPAAADRFDITGPFAAGLDVDADNLVMRALSAVRAKASVPPLSITLTKNLPIASGIGGGSADAAALLRALQGSVDLHDTVWADIALSLGADVPVCLHARTAHMSGIGEDLRLWPDLGTVASVLINPGVAVSTAQTFKDFDSGQVRETPRPQRADGSLLLRALDGRNDLQPPAVAAQPVIQTVIDAIAAQDGCDLARMSGSGATCFGLFSSGAQAQAAASNIAKDNPDWWVVPTRLGDAA